MIEDFFTKPLQGKAFNIYRDLIMGYKHIKELSMLELSTIKERVDKPKNIMSGETTSITFNTEKPYTSDSSKNVKNTPTYANVVSGK